MTDKAIITLGDTKLEAPLIVGTEDERAIDIGAAPRQDRVRHARPGVHEHGVDQERHHVHRRRQGHPALPRHPDRAARREVDVRRDGVPAHLRAPAERDAAPGVEREAHAPLADPRGHEALLRGLPGRRRTRWRSSARWSRRSRATTPTRSTSTTSTSATSRSRASCRRCARSRRSPTRSRSASRSSIRRTRSRTARTS